MKVLIVSEGTHDVGRRDLITAPRPARGVVSILARKVCFAESDELLALHWQEIVRLRPELRRKPAARKVAAAIVASAVRYGCDGTVIVLDQDLPGVSASDLSEGRERGLAVLPAGRAHPVVCAQAVLSIESWTLGAKQVLAQLLKIDVGELQREYFPIAPEQFNNNSGQENRRGKAILREIARKLGYDDCLEFREAVAELTDIRELEATCPHGFAPFARDMRNAFGSPSVGLPSTEP